MVKFDFNDILLEAAVTSNVNSRQDVNPFLNGLLPLITAPMDTVISFENSDVFLDNNIVPCLPRGTYKHNEGFESFSLNEILEKLTNSELEDNGYYLIDIANGHMRKLISAIKVIKIVYPNCTLMVGNVANPQTYVKLSEAGADMVRIGIGNGGACTSTVHTGVGYPMGSLIQECYQASLTLEHPAKIVADGGMKGYSDIIKALALGADYVMVGSLLNKAIESCGQNYLFKYIPVSQTVAKFSFKLGLPVYKKYRGMSTLEVQKKWGKKLLRTSEGITTYRKVEYSVSEWSKNFEGYLRSAMSYTNSSNLTEFIGGVNIIKISDNAYNRFKK